MVKGRERTPHERETLLFPTREEAQAWTEDVTERVAEVARPGVRRDREVVGQALAQEFEKHGEAVGPGLTRPWEHSEAEHTEVQQLVDTVFAKDLGVAIRQAQRSHHYPRNIDLLHDVLTAELYEAMAAQRVNRQPVRVGLVVMVGVVILVAVILVGLMVL